MKKESKADPTPKGLPRVCFSFTVILLLIGCQQQNEPSTVPLYAGCEEYSQKLKAKVSADYDVDIEIFKFDSSLVNIDRVYGYMKVAGRDKGIVINSLKYLCYPKNRYKTELDMLEVSQVKSIASDINSRGSVYFVDFSGPDISINYNGISESDKQDVLR